MKVQNVFNIRFSINIRLEKIKKKPVNRNVEQ